MGRGRGERSLGDCGRRQVEQGIDQALSRVKSTGVIVEGNSFLDYVEADFAIMCARAGENKLKTSARRTLERADALYLSTIDDCDASDGQSNDLKNGAPDLTS